MWHNKLKTRNFTGATQIVEQSDEKKLSPNEYYQCPLPHTHPRHEQAFFKNFETHFNTFKTRDDHFSLLRLHEEISWEFRRSESEKHNLKEDDLRRISFLAWFEAIRRQTGQKIKVIARK